MFNVFFVDMISDWRLWLVIVFLASVTLVTSTAKYRLGQKGLDSLKEHYPKVSDDRWMSVEGYFDRWGATVVLFSFLPLLGWIIPPAAGAFGVRFRPFLVWAFIAKMVRYWILFFIVFGAINAFS